MHNSSLSVEIEFLNYIRLLAGDSSTIFEHFSYIPMYISENKCIKRAKQSVVITAYLYHQWYYAIAAFVQTLEVDTKNSEKLKFNYTHLLLRIIHFCVAILCL